VAEAVVRLACCRVVTVPPAPAAAPAAPDAIEEIAETVSCAMCARPSQGELLCEACRARIRGEALERKRVEERAGR